MGSLENLVIFDEGGHGMVNWGLMEAGEDALSCVVTCNAGSGVMDRGWHQTICLMSRIQIKKMKRDGWALPRASDYRSAMREHWQGVRARCHEFVHSVYGGKQDLSC